MEKKPRYKMTLSSNEFDRLYLEDLETTQRRSQYRTKDIISHIHRAKSFPCKYVYREMHGAEEFRGYSVIQSKKEPFREGMDVDSVVFFKNSRGICAYINLDPYEVLTTEVYFSIGNKYAASHRYLFTPHFFDRYRMRYGIEAGYSDIYNQFFFNNITTSLDGLFTQVSTARADDYKTLDVWSLCEDGLMLGQIHGMEEDFLNGKPYIMQINTFLDIDTLTKRQDRYANVLNSMKEYYDKMPKMPESELSLKKRTFITRVGQL